VQVDVSRFNPKKLVAGGGDGMSLWISRGVVDLHGGQVLLYVPPVEFESAAKVSAESSPASTARPGSMRKLSKQQSQSMQSSRVFFSGHHGKTVVVELPMTRVLTPDDQAKLTRLQAALHARRHQGDAGGHAEEEDDEDMIDDIMSFSPQSSVSSLAMSRKDMPQRQDSLPAGPGAGTHSGGLPHVADTEKDNDAAGSPSTHPAAVRDNKADVSGRGEEVDVVEMIDDHAFGVSSRRASVAPVHGRSHSQRHGHGHGHGHGAGGGSRRVSAVPMHLRDRRGSAWVALDEQGTSYASPFRVASLSLSLSLTHTHTHTHTHDCVFCPSCVDSGGGTSGVPGHHRYGHVPPPVRLSVPPAQPPGVPSRVVQP